MPPEVQNALDQTAGALAGAGEAFTTPPDEAAPLPAGSNLPALMQDVPFWRDPRFSGYFAGGMALLLLLTWLLLDRHDIVVKVPWLSGVYKAIGLSVAQVGEGLVLQQVHSERRYEEGTMRLVVEGEVYNASAMEIEVPDIKASALGPDGKAMESWKISAPVSRLDAGEAAPFRSAVTTPEGTVKEVNLSFVGSHDVHAE